MPCSWSVLLAHLSSIVFSLASHSFRVGWSGKIRSHLARLLQSSKLLTLSPTQFNYLWVTDFPLFDVEKLRVSLGNEQTNDSTKSNENQKLHIHDLGAMHHPFTAPSPSSLQALLKILPYFLPNSSTSSSTSSSSYTVINENLLPLSSYQGVSNVQLSPSELISTLCSLRGQHYDIVLNGFEVGSFLWFSYFSLFLLLLVFAQLCLFVRS
jgi:aspartyl-tRNA synthetase